VAARKAIAGVVLLGAVVVGLACSNDEATRPTASSTTLDATTCERASLTHIPSDLTLVATNEIAHPDGAQGTQEVYESADQARGVAIASGAVGTTEGAGGTPRPMTIRGHEASVLDEQSPMIATWYEAEEGERCALYSVTAYGLATREFVEVLEGVR
jgi:hypothetical protein